MRPSTKLHMGMAALLLGVGATAAAPLGVSAQDVQVRVEHDGAAAGDTDVFSFVNGIKTRRGTTTPDGETSLPPGTFAEGEEVVVWVRACAGGDTEVILAPEGEGDPCADDAPAEAEDCACRRIGVVAWQPGSTVLVDTGIGTVMVGQPGAPALGPDVSVGYRGAGIEVGLGAELISFGNSEVATDQSSLVVRGSTADSFGYGIGGFGEGTLPIPLGDDLRLVGGVNFRYGMAPDVEHLVPGGRVTAETGYWGLGPYVGLRLRPFEPVSFGVDGGASWWSNSTSLSADGANGLEIDRSESNWNAFGRAFVQPRLSERWRLRAALEFNTGGGDDDFDSSLLIGNIGVTYGFPR